MCFIESFRPLMFFLAENIIQKAKNRSCSPPHTALPLGPLLSPQPPLLFFSSLSYPWLLMNPQLKKKVGLKKQKKALPFPYLHHYLKTWICLLVIPFPSSLTLYWSPSKFYHPPAAILMEVVSLTLSPFFLGSWIHISILEEKSCMAHWLK